MNHQQNLSPELNFFPSPATVSFEHIAIKLVSDTLVTLQRDEQNIEGIKKFSHIRKIKVAKMPFSPRTTSF